MMIMGAFNKLLGMFSWILLQITLKDMCFVNSHDVFESTNLYNELFNSIYNEKIIPLCENKSKVTLELQAALRQIMDVNEVAQVITVNIWIRMKWNDCRLKWNVSSHGNLSYFHVPIDTIWVPDITVYDSASDENVMPGKLDYYAAIYYDGNVTYQFPTIIKSICRVDVTYFPVDSQMCSIKFGSWSHHGTDFDVTSITKQADLSSYFVHQEWKLLGMPVVRHELYYNCCEEPFPDLTYYLELRRKPTFYIMTVFFPGILMSFLTALTFYLPVESGEKVALGITVLLSLTVLLLLVSESLPASSDSLPFIGIYFASSMVLVSISCFMTAVVLNYHYRGCSGKKVPALLKRCIIEGLGSVLCANAKNEPTEDKTGNDIEMTNVSDESVYGLSTLSDETQGTKRSTVFGNYSVKELHMRARIVDAMQGQKTALKHLAYHVHNFESRKEAWREWHMLSRVLDRLFFLIYLVATIITSGTFVAILSTH